MCEGRWDFIGRGQILARHHLMTCCQLQLCRSWVTNNIILILLIFIFLKAYHSECYLKSKGPKCEHCCFALIAFPDKGLSGRCGVYNGCKYHEECYMQYAGPRCSACFDVITFNPENGFSGKWIDDGNKQYHEECYKKKIFVEMRAKHS